MSEPSPVRADLPGLVCGTIVAVVFLAIYSYGIWGGAQVSGGASAAQVEPATIGADHE